MKQASPVRIMGIVNVTPDSFSDGGRHDTAERAVAHALQLASEGADMLDIGGESTRPGADPVPAEEEWRRVGPVLEELARLRREGRLEARLSIDTRKSLVMRRAIDLGVDIINDVTALTHDPDSLEVAAASTCDIVLMHGRGNPKTMQDNPHYEDVVGEVRAYLAARLSACAAAGIAHRRLLIDPGIGFGKTLAHNLQLLRHLDRLTALGAPVLLGVSRKRFIGALSGEEHPARRLPGSLAAGLFGAQQGASVLRVHDVAATRQALAVWQALAEK